MSSDKKERGTKTHECFHESFQETLTGSSSVETNTTVWDPGTFTKEKRTPQKSYMKNRTDTKAKDTQQKTKGKNLMI